LQLAMHVLAAGACPDLSAFKPVVEPATAVLLAAIGASILAVVVYAGFKYHGSLGKQRGIAEAKSILIHSAKGLAIAALAVPIVALAMWVLGGTICGL
jgi:hypothetical protein